MSNKKIYFRSFFDGLVKWKNFIICIIICVVAFIGYKKYDKTVNYKVAPEVLIPHRVDVVKEGVKQILCKQAVIETVMVDTVYVDLNKKFYENPYGIQEIKKSGKRLSAVMFRRDENNLYTYRKNVWRMDYNNDYTLSPTKDPNNPFTLSEKRDLIGFSIATGLSALDKPYIETGIYLKDISFKNTNIDVGIVSYVSFFRQDLRLEARHNF